MAWHIFRKDLTLLWPVALLSAVAQFGLYALTFLSDRSPDEQYLLLAARLSVLVVFLAVTLAIALGVHQEPIPGATQDWLVRPIRRLDLLLAKLLFVLAAVQLPMFLGDLGEALAHGFAWPEAASAAAARNLYVFVALSLPAFAFAALTRNTAQFVGAGVAYFIAMIVSTVLLNLVTRAAGQEQATNPLSWTGVDWIAQGAGRLALAAGAVIALALLYFRRKVALARGLFPAFAVLSAFAVLLPWTWIFAVQEAASAAPAGEPTVSIAFDPRAARYQLPPGTDLDAYTAGAGQVQLRGRAAGDIAVEDRSRRALGAVTVFLPVRVSGLTAADLPWADRAVVTLTAADGRVVFSGRGDDFKTRPAASGSPAALAYEALRIPALAYEAAANEPLSLRIDYSMSVLRPRPAVSAPALGADGRLPGLGRCATGRDSDGDDIELRCVKAGRAPSCISATLADPASGRRNPETLICAPDYAPFGQRPFPDALSRFEVEAPFRDRLGVAAYPVGAGELGRARMVVVAYEAAGHLTRQVAARGVRLSDWTAQARPARP
jgi:hypothetical protein